MSGSLQGLFDELAADTSTGEAIEAEADALVVAAKGKPERVEGSTTYPAEDPDWKQVQAQALELLERSRDLQILSTLALARLNMGGIVGYAEVVGFVATLLDTHWEALHPQLDPEDDNDPMTRSNATLVLADARVLRALREYPLVSSPRVGRFSWRDISMAQGTLEPEAGTEKPLESTIAGAAQEGDAAELSAVHDALAALTQSLKKIGAVFDDRAGYGSGPDLTRLEKLVGEMLKMVERYTPSGGGAETEGEAAPTGAVGGAPAAAGGVPIGAIGAVNTRADAMRLLDLVCAYYERSEPSSPLPMLIQRARRLADKSFLEIIQDIAPDGLTQAQIVVGQSSAD